MPRDAVEWQSGCITEGTKNPRNQETTESAPGVQSRNPGRAYTAHATKPPLTLQWQCLTRGQYALHRNKIPTQSPPNDHTDFPQMSIEYCSAQRKEDISILNSAVPTEREIALS
jgi:hypothetical protein